MKNSFYSLFRGGSWGSYPKGCGSAYRDLDTRGDLSNGISFRIVKKEKIN